MTRGRQVHRLHQRIGMAFTVALAASLVCTGALSACGSDEDGEDTEETEVAYSGSDGDSHIHSGSDDHIDINPVRDDPTIAATAAASNWWTWLPADQPSVWSVTGDAVDEVFSGDLHEQAEKADSDAAKKANPRNWDRWKKMGVSVEALVLDATEDEADAAGGSGDSSDLVTSVDLTVRQNLTSEAGIETFDEFTVTAHLVATDDHWTVAEFTDQKSVD